MQVSTKLGCISTLCACFLLVGPNSIVRALENVVDTVQMQDQQHRKATAEGIQRRNSRCELSGKLFDAPTSDGQGTESRTGWNGAQQQGREVWTATGGFLNEQYKAATAEIRERLGQEGSLFALNFVLLLTLMGVLFSLFRSTPIEEFERFVQKRRAAVFFIAALLGSAIIDIRLRFNSRIIESLGDWVWCIEQQHPDGVSPSHTWEHFLQLQLETGSFPVMRYCSHTLSALLFGIIVYLFVVMPRTMNRATKTMVNYGAVLFFGFLCVVALSYGPIGNGRLGGVSALVTTVVVAVIGIWCLTSAFEDRFAKLNAFTLTADLSDSFMDSLSDIARDKLLEARVHFGRAYRTDELLAEMRHDPPEDRRKVNDLIFDQVGVRVAADELRPAAGNHNRKPLAKDPESSVPRITGGPGSSGEAFEVGLRGRELHLQLRKNPEPADLAEEVLWQAYFLDRKLKANWSP